MCISVEDFVLKKSESLTSPENFIGNNISVFDDVLNRRSNFADKTKIHNSTINENFESDPQNDPEILNISQNISEISIKNNQSPGNPGYTFPGHLIDNSMLDNTENLRRVDDSREFRSSSENVPENYENVSGNSPNTFESLDSNIFPGNSKNSSKNLRYSENKITISDNPENSKDIPGNSQDIPANLNSSEKSLKNSQFDDQLNESTFRRNSRTKRRSKKLLKTKLFCPPEDIQQIPRLTLEFSSNSRHQPSFAKNFPISNSSNKNRLQIPGTSKNQQNLTNFSILSNESDLSSSNTKFNSFIEHLNEPQTSHMKNFPQNKVIALRECTDKDLKLKTNSEVIVKVSKINFSKIYIVKKLENVEKFNEFCKSPNSRRSKFFKMKGDKVESSIRVKRLPKENFQDFCESECQNEVIEKLTEKLEDTFSVLKIKKNSDEENEEEFMALDIEVKKDPLDDLKFIVTKKIN